MARLRAVVVVVVVLVLGAWTCQVPTDSAGSAGSADVPVTTTGLTALLTGEDWHYVGDTGEPAFSDGWSNVGSPWPSMAFRMRGGGVVDLVAVITTSATFEVVFTIPAAYRPLGSRRVPIPYTRSRSGTLSARMGDIELSGVLTATGANTVGDIVYINTSYFIGNADAP